MYRILKILTLGVAGVLVGTVLKQLHASFTQYAAILISVFAIQIITVFDCNRLLAHPEN